MRHKSGYNILWRSICDGFMAKLYFDLGEQIGGSETVFFTHAEGGYHGPCAGALADESPKSKNTQKCQNVN